MATVDHPEKPRRKRADKALQVRTDDRRGQILKIAARLFADIGFETATIRMIAKEADILSGSLYHHFGTKEEMLHGILDRGVREMREATGRIARAAADAEVRLVALILLYMQELFDDHEAFSILYNDRRFLRRHPDFAYVGEAKKVMFFNWCAVLDEGKAAGLFRTDLDDFMAITTVIRMLSTSADWFMRQNDYTYDGTLPSERGEVVRFNIDVVLRIIRAPDRITDAPPLSDAEALLAAN